MKILIIVPAFNEEKTILSVIKDLFFYGYKNIVLIDDGSLDGTAEVAKNTKIKILRHIINRGLGAALGTGFKYAKDNNYDIAVTFDSDGQHKASDLKKLLNPIIENKADVVIGNRMSFYKKEMPLDRLIINYLADLLTFLLYGVWMTDSQSGLRAFNKKAVGCIKILTEKMEVSSEFLKEIKKNNLRLAEVPIRPVYTDYSRRSGQNNLNAVAVGFKMFLRLFR